jgi:DNA-binding MarR family transcriptional regulator
MRMTQGRTSRSAPAKSPDADAVTDAVLAASRLLVGLSARSIASVDESITMPQFRLLVVLSTRGPMNLGMLAEHLDVKPSTATRMIDRLVTADLVNRQVSPVSRREVVIDLTDAGVSVVTRVMRQRRREIGRIVTRMPERQRVALVEAFAAFSAAGGEPPTDSARYADWI